MEYQNHSITENGKQVLTALYRAHEHDDADYLTTSEIRDETELDNTEAVRHQLDEYLRPAGLVETTNPGVEPGQGQLPLRVSLTDEGRKVCEWYSERVLVDLSSGESVAEQVQRLRGQIAVISEGEFTGDEMDTVWTRMNAIEERQDEIEARLDEIEGRLDRIDQIEQKADDLLDAEVSDLPFISESDFVMALREIVDEIANAYDGSVTRAQLGDKYLKAAYRDRELPDSESPRMDHVLDVATDDAEQEESADDVDEEMWGDLDLT